MASAGSDAAVAAHMGPTPVTGTITAAQRQTILQETQCSAAARARSQWGARMLTITGPAPKLDDAHRMALRFIEENGEEGGRAVEKEEQENQKKDNKKRPWCGQNWKGWSWGDSNWRDWVPRQEYEDLQEQLRAAEKEVITLQYRLASWENWHFWGQQQSQQWHAQAHRVVFAPAVPQGQAFCAAPAHAVPANRSAEARSPTISPPPSRSETRSEAPTLVPVVEERPSASARRRRRPRGRQQNNSSDR